MLVNAAPPTTTQTLLIQMIGTFTNKQVKRVSNLFVLNLYKKEQAVAMVLNMLVCS